MKKVFVFLGIIAALILIILGANKYLLSGRSSFQSIYMVPPDAAIIIESNAVFDAWNNIIYSEAWKKISHIEALSELNQEIQSVDSVLSQKQWLLKAVGKRRVLVSIHPYTAGKYDLLYVLNIGRATRMRNPETLFASLLGDSYRITKRPYGTYSIYEMLDKESGELYIFSFVNDKAVMSTNYKLVEASLNEMDKMTLGRDLDYIDVSKRISGKGLFNVYINYREFPEYLRHTMGLDNQTVSDLEKQLTYSALSFDISKEGLITLEGFTGVNDSVYSFYNSVLNAGKGSLEGSHIIPARVASLVKISFDDASEYYRNSLNNLSPDELASYLKTLNKLEKKLKISVEENFLDWIDDEIVLLQTQPSNLGRNNEFAAIIKAKNEKDHKTNMDYISRQIERNFPVRIREVAYSDHTISYISFPGLLKTLFGKTLGKIEKPYYTFIDEYIIFSNHPQTLKNIIDDYQSGKTLESSIDFYNFSDHFDKKSNAFTYFDLPVLFTNLRQFVDTKTWQDLTRNKPYIISFPQVGIQIDEKDDLLHLLIKAKYDEYTEEYDLQRFDSHSFLNLFDEEEETTASDPHRGWDSPRIIIHDLDASEVIDHYGADSIKFEASLKKGIKHGSYKAYHKNGEVMVKGRYRDDLRDGKWRLYDDEGNLIEEKLFSEGKEITE